MGRCRRQVAEERLDGFADRPPQPARSSVSSKHSDTQSPSNPSSPKRLRQDGFHSSTLSPSPTRSVCPRDCPDVCGMLAHVEHGKIVRVVGDPENPITQGFLCARFQHYEELIHHSDRLLYPLARASKRDAFERVSWEEALDLICTRFQAILDEHGGPAILPYSYFGHMGVVSNRFADRLWNRMNAARVGAEICSTAADEAVLRSFGRIRGTEPHHLGKTKFYLAWGKNPKETNVHAWTQLRMIRPLVVVDPFESDTAAAADLHVRPRPGTDSLLAIGMMRLLIERGFVDNAFLAERTTGYEALRDRVLATPLEQVEADTNVPRAELEELTRLYAELRPGLIHVGVGLQRNLNGGEMVAAVCMLAALTGQVGTPGGGVLVANYDWRLNDISYVELRTDAPRYHNMVHLGRDLVESDEIRALYVYNQNPAATCPNQTLVRRGLAREDLFLVVHDLFLTDTAQLANVVLPACSFAEQPDLHLSYWHDYVQLNQPIIEPIGESRSNHRVFMDIARGLGFREPCFSHSEEDVMHEALRGTGIELDALRKGPVLWGDLTRTSFDDGVFATPSGKLELAVPTYTPAARDGKHPYRFLTPKTKHLQGSQVFNLPRKEPILRIPWVFIHPEDAAAEGIVEGDPVRLANQRGSVDLVAKVSARTQPGVVVSYMVRWGPNANATTPDDEADMGGNSTFHSNFVRLARLSGGGQR